MNLLILLRICSQNCLSRGRHYDVLAAKAFWRKQRVICRHSTNYGLNLKTSFMLASFHSTSAFVPHDVVTLIWPKFLTSAKSTMVCMHRTASQVCKCVALRNVHIYSTAQPMSVGTVVEDVLIACSIKDLSTGSSSHVFWYPRIQRKIRNMRSTERQ